MNKIHFSVSCPLNTNEAQKIFDTYKNTDLELYFGIDKYVVIFIGKRTYKYTKNNPAKSIINKIEYTLKNML